MRDRVCNRKLNRTDGREGKVRSTVRTGGAETALQYDLLLLIKRMCHVTEAASTL